VTKLTSDAIRADTVFPESFAFPVFMKFMLARQREEFMLTMSEPTLLSIVAETKF